VERHGPVDQDHAGPPVPTPHRVGTGGRRGGPARQRRVRRVRPESVLMCSVGALLVASSAALLHLTPPAATANAVTVPLPVSEPVTSSLLPAPALAAPPIQTPMKAPVKKGRARVAPAPPRDAEAAPPRNLRIQAAGIDTALVNLRRQRDGTLEVPTDFARAGWYREGTKPGDRGPAVLVGHVDSYDGPAVFYNLKDLKRGDRITVDRVDGSRVVFAMYAKETVQKDAFPTSRVYGDTDQPELRLITCGGPFDAQAKSYLDNVVVYAKQVTG